MGRTQRILGGSETILMWGIHVIIHVSPSIECTAPK